MNPMAEALLITYASNVTAVALYNYVNMYLVHRSAKKKARKGLKYRKHLSHKTNKYMRGVLNEAVHEMNAYALIPGVNVIEALGHKCKMDRYQKIFDSSYQAFAFLDDTDAYKKRVIEQIVSLCVISNIPDDITFDLVNDKDLGELIETKEKMIQIIEEQLKQNELKQELLSTGLEEEAKKAAERLSTYIDEIKKMKFEPLFDETKKDKSDDDSEKPSQKKLK